MAVRTRRIHTCCGSVEIYGMCLLMCTIDGGEGDVFYLVFAGIIMDLL